MGIYSHAYGTDIKMSGLLAEVVGDCLPDVLAYRKDVRLTRQQLRDIIIPKICERIETGLPLRRDADPNLQLIWGLRNDLTSLAALVQWASTKRPDNELLCWH